MINDEVMAAVAAWVGEVIPEIGDRTYKHQPGSKNKGLPDAVVALGSESLERDGGDEFPLFGLQQVSAYVWRMGVSLMVENGVTEADAEAADEKLRAYAAAIIGALADDPFLGDRLVDHAQASPWSFSFDYNRNGPLVEYEDGTIGREATFTLAVAEPVSAID